jgi:hypothetical protein
MAQHLVRIALVSLAVVLSCSPVRAQTTIAHWSFDTPTITTGVGGRIETAADSTGTHNATSVFNGTGVTINSVAGQFGQAALLTNTIGNQPTNNAYMDFPSLTEIAGPTAGDFTFAAWANIPLGTSTADDNTIIADWGNAAAGTHRFTYWFLLDNVDTNSAARPRGQIRAANSPPDPATIDIIATTLNATQAGATNFVDGAWHHYVWAWNKEAGTMTYFIDGVQRHVQTSTQTNRDLLISDSPVQQLGAKRDNNRYFSGNMDEVWVFGDDLTPEQVTELFQTNTPPGGVVVPTNLTLQIDPVTGATQLMNTTSNPITFNSYRLTSPSGGLNPAGWNPIANGNEHQDEFPLGDGNGNGWEVAPNPGAGELVEWYLTNDSTLDPNETLFLGNAFNPASEHDVVFRYTSSDLALKNGIIEFVTVNPPAGITGDYNNNGVVDAADYVLWRKNLGQPVTLPNDSTPGDVSQDDYTVWRANFGRTPGSGAELGAVDAAPEPAAAALLVLGALLGTFWRRAKR